MKKIAFLLSLLLGLSVCSCSSSKNENDTKKISIGDVSFNYTYSTISFEFQSNSNAKNYNAYFSQGGKSRSILQNIIPQKEYDFSFLVDGDYDVLFKAFANPGYVDSDSKLIGTVHKYKTEKNADDIILSATVTQNYSIKINVSNKNSDDKTSVAVRIKKDSTTFKLFQHVSTPSELETDADLPAGSYEITAFFEETEDSLQSLPLNLNKDLIIPQRQSILSDFKAELVNDNIVLTWNQSLSGNLDRKLTITHGSTKEEFTNYYNGKILKSGITIPANSFGAGNLPLTFTLQLIPNQYEETFLASEIVSAKTMVSILKYNTPIISAAFQENGNVKINCSNPEEGKYKLQVVSESGQEVENQIFFNGSVNSFPISTKKAGEKWGIGTFQIKLTKLANNNNELNSESGTTSVATQKILLVPDVSFKTGENKITAEVSAFSDLFKNLCDEKEFFVTAILRDANKNEKETKELSPNQECTFDLSGLPDGSYQVSCSISESTKNIIGKKGFNYSAVDSKSVNKLTPPTPTEVNYLISNMTSEKAQSMGGSSAQYRIYVDSDYEDIFLISVSCSFYCKPGGGAPDQATQWVAGNCSSVSTFQNVAVNSKRKYVTFVATRPTGWYTSGQKCLSLSITVGKDNLIQTLSLVRDE